MSRKALNRSALVIFVVTCMFALSACWSSNPTTADPGAVFHHDFSLVPGIGPGILTSCFEVRSRNSNHKYLCRIVEGDERVGQPGNWDVKFDGGDHPVISNCFDIFDLYKCYMVAPDGMTYTGCIPYQDGGVDVWWCDYKEHNWFTLETNGDWRSYVWHTFWEWGTKGVANELQCAYGLMGLYTGESQYGEDWLVSCFEGPL